MFNVFYETWRWMEERNAWDSISMVQTMVRFKWYNDIKQSLKGIIDERHLEIFRLRVLLKNGDDNKKTGYFLDQLKKLIKQAHKYGSGLFITNH